MTDTARRRWERRMMLGGNAIPEAEQERRVRRMMTDVGARPLGHAEPVKDEGPQAPTASVTNPVPPVPSAPPAEESAPDAVEAPVTVPKQARPRITEWWRTGRPEIGKPDEEEDGPQVPIRNDGQDDDDQDDEQEHDDQDDDEDASKGGGNGGGGGGGRGRPQGPRGWRSRLPGRQAPVKKITGTATPRGDGRWRILAFNGSAAAVGYSIGLTDHVHLYLSTSQSAASGMFSLVLAGAGAWAGWKLFGHGAVYRILPCAPVSRILLTVGAAEFGRRLGPVPVAYLNTYGQEWGLGPSSISLLITAAGICGGLYWLCDRHARRWSWPVRWLARIPLASALLAVALYTGTSAL